MDAFEAKWLYFTYKKRRLKLLLDQLMSINKCSIITVPLIAPVGLLFTGYVCAGLRLSKNRLYSPIHGKPIYFDWLDFSYVDCRFSFSFYKLIFLSGVEDNSFRWRGEIWIIRMTVVRLLVSLYHFGNVQNFNLSKSCPHGT